jgi:hypothetical protein
MQLLIGWLRIVNWEGKEWSILSQHSLGRTKICMHSRPPDRRSNLAPRRCEAGLQATGPAMLGFVSCKELSKICVLACVGTLTNVYGMFANLRAVLCCEWLFAQQVQDSGNTRWLVGTPQYRVKWCVGKKCTRLASSWVNNRSWSTAS